MTNFNWMINVHTGSLLLVRERNQSCHQLNLEKKIKNSFEIVSIFLEKKKSLHIELGGIRLSSFYHWGAFNSNKFSPYDSPLPG